MQNTNCTACDLRIDPKHAYWKRDFAERSDGIRHIVTNTPQDKDITDYIDDCTDMSPLKCAQTHDYSDDVLRIKKNGDDPVMHDSERLQLHYERFSKDNVKDDALHIYKMADDPVEVQVAVQIPKTDAIVVPYDLFTKIGHHA